MTPRRGRHTSVETHKAGCSRTWFNDAIEIVQFDAEGGISSSSSSQSVESTGPRAAKRQSSTAPVKIVLGPQVSRGSSSSMSCLLEADCSHGGLSTALDDNDAEEVAEENVFAKAAQRRRIRHSVTANQGPGLPPHALPAMAMSRILSRRRGSTLSTASSGSADGSIDCSAESR